MEHSLRVVVVLCCTWALLALGSPPSVHAEGSEDAQSAADDDGCEVPCPGEGEDGTCPPDCNLCVCCPSAGAAPVVLGSLPSAWAPGPSSDDHAELVHRLPEEPTSRLFRPPIPPLS